MRVWGASPSRSLFERQFVRPALAAAAALSFVVSLGLGLGCGAKRSAVASGESLAEVGDQKLLREYVAHVAARDELDEAAARAKVAETLRLVAMRREQLGDAAELQPARESHIRGAALVRAYLKSVFEPAHGADVIDDDYVAPWFDDPTGLARFYHPQLHYVCQIIVVPGQEEGATSTTLAPDSDAWRAGAQAFAEPIFRRFREREIDLAQEEECVLFNTMFSREVQASPDGAYMARFEQGVFDIALPDRWVAEWVDALEQHGTTGFVPTFTTKYGLHLVMVLKIMPDTRVEPPDGTDAEKRAVNEAALRQRLLNGWRAKRAFPEHLKTLAAKHVVRLATGLEPG